MRETSRTVHVAGLLIAAVGVSIEYLTGVPGFPLVPPGPFILAGAALVVALVRWRWIVLVGLAAAAFLTVGAVAAGTTAQVLAEPGVIGQFLGAVVQVVGLLVALVAGALALRKAMVAV